MLYALLKIIFQLLFRTIFRARVIGAPCDVSMPQSVVFPLTVWISSGSVFGSVFMAVSFVGCGWLFLLPCNGDG